MISPPAEFTPRCVFDRLETLRSKTVIFTQVADFKLVSKQIYQAREAVDYLKANFTRDAIARGPVVKKAGGIR